VTALDHNPASIGKAELAEARRIAGDVLRLPFGANSFDLVFFQNTLLWIADAESACQEAARVLDSGGALVAVEPDYGGMMEHPDWGIRQLWIQGLSEAGADPFVGRKLPGACEAAGLRTWVELAHIPQPAEAAALKLLDGLPLTAQQCQIAANVARAIEQAPGQWSFFLHVPYFLIVATKQDRGQDR
jgi:SAM-dependent methyltransferase